MKIRFEGTQQYEADLSDADLEELGLPPDATPIEVYQALSYTATMPQAQRLMDRLAGEGTWVRSGMYRYNGVIRAAADA